MLMWLINFKTFIDIIYLNFFAYFKKIFSNILDLLYHFLMKYTESTLPQDQIQLKTIVLDQQCKLEEQQKIIEHIRQQYDNLQHQIKCLLRNQYGRKSEQGIPGQGNLFDSLNTDHEQILEQPQEEKIITDARKKSGKRQLPKHLPRKRIEYDIPEDQRICDCGCQQSLKKIGEEILEQLEVIPAQLFVIQHVRFKYGCVHGSKVITAEMPRQPIDKAMAGAGLLADTIIKKYDDHLPLYRQSEMWARQNIDIARSTLCDWVGACAKQLKPIVEQMQKEVLTSPKINSDDTPVPVLDPGSGRTKTGRLWVYLGAGKNAPSCAVYEYTPTRQQAGPMEFLKGYSGYLQVDAYSGYDILFRKEQKDYAITEVACMAHVRRKFYEIAEQTKTTGSAHQALSYIQRLYAVEKEARSLDDEARKELRERKSKPLLADFKNWLDKLINRVIPKSPLGNAVNYALKNWEALERYLEDGMLDIDNNAAERLIKPVKIGAKNWIFAGNDQGAKNAAIFYSLIETCKLHEINPYDYLRDVLKRLPTQLNSKINELLPWNWKTTRNDSS